jgi:hypothetical protein
MQQLIAQNANLLPHVGCYPFSIPKVPTEPHHRVHPLAGGVVAVRADLVHINFIGRRALWILMILN